MQAIYSMITIDPPSPRGTSASGFSSHLPASRLPALRGFLKRAQVAAGVTNDVSILLTTDGTLRRLNREFRGKDKPTDVLSFPAVNFPGQKKAQALAGDLAISLDTAARQARSFGHAVEVEIRILILHGLLHLGGFDHEKDPVEMAAREEELRRRFRLPVALIARTQSKSRRGRA